MFMPSQRVLDIIGWEERISVRRYTVMPANLPEAGWRGVIGGTLSEIESHYFAMDQLETQGIGSVLGDALSNAQEHGSKNGTPFVFGLLMGNSGVCYGFRDEGGYFRRADVKEKFEKKTPLTERDMDPDAGGARAGVNTFIFGYTDAIEVDTDKGILYCVQTLERIVRGEPTRFREYSALVRSNLPSPRQ